MHFPLHVSKRDLSPLVTFESLEHSRNSTPNWSKISPYTVFAYDSRWTEMSVSKSALLSCPGMYMDLMAYSSCFSSQYWQMRCWALWLDW